MNPASVTSNVGNAAVLAWGWAAALGPRLLAALLILVAGMLLSRWMQHGIVAISRRSGRYDATLLPVLLAVTRYGIFIFVVLLMLNQLGIQTTSLLAVLGAAGLAVGLALQGTLSNIAAGIMLLWLRPFRVGDYIEVNNMSGVVVETGLFACTLRTFDGMRLFAPNSTLWNFALRNHTGADKRLLAVSVTVATEQESAVRAALATVLRDTAGVLQQPAPDIFLEQVTSAAVTLTCRFWTPRHDYGELQRSIVETLRTRLLAAGIAPADLQQIVRVQPAPADPTRLIDI